jgi:hypothetical protein
MEVPFLDKAATYRIKVQGIVPENWVNRLGGLQIAEVSSTQTTLEGWLPDQAALKGVLDTLYELRLSLNKVDVCDTPLACVERVSHAGRKGVSQ